jgi:hypothetical protein
VKIRVNGEELVFSGEEVESVEIVGVEGMAPLVM